MHSLRRNLKKNQLSYNNLRYGLLQTFVPTSPPSPAFFFTLPSTLPSPSPEKKNYIIVLHCKTSNKRYPNKIEAGLKKLMTAVARESIVSWLVVLLYFRVSFVSFPFLVQKEMKIVPRFIFFLIFHFSEKKKNSTQIFFFHFSMSKKKEMKIEHRFLFFIFQFLRN